MIKKLFDLSCQEKRLIITIFYLLNYYWLYLRLGSLEKMINNLQARSVVASRTKPSSLDVVDLISSCAWRFSWLNNCLLRSLVGYVLLLRQGVQAVLLIGTRKDPGDVFSAHAWLEDSEGNLLGQAPEQRDSFEVIARIRSRA